MKKILIIFGLFITIFGFTNHTSAYTAEELNNYKNYLQKGSNALKVTKNYNEAVINFEKALKINPHDYNTLCALAMSYGHLGNNVKAEEVLLTAVKRFPNEWLAYTFLGDLKLFQKQRQEGINYYKKAISLPSMPQKYRDQYQQMIQKM